MPTLIPQPARIQSAGNKPKIIEEYVGRVNTSTGGISVALARTFTLIDTEMKTVGSQEWERAFTLFRLLI